MHKARSQENQGIYRLESEEMLDQALVLTSRDRGLSNIALSDYARCAHPTISSLYTLEYSILYYNLAVCQYLIFSYLPYVHLRQNDLVHHNNQLRKEGSNDSRLVGKSQA
jgi:hypothetical protein